MFDKAKPNKQDLRKLAQGMDVASTLGAQLAALDRAIESGLKSLVFVDGDARKELSRTQLSLGVGHVYLRRLISSGEAYLAGLRTKQTPKTKMAGKTKTAKARVKASKTGGKKKETGRTSAKAARR